jgi:hypothetical protein
MSGGVNTLPKRRDENYFSLSSRRILVYTLEYENNAELRIPSLKDARSIDSYNQMMPESPLKGLGHENRIQIFGQKFTVLKYKNPAWFSNFKNAPLMRCRHYYLSRGSGGNILEE